MNIQRKSVTELFGLPDAPKNGRERLLTVAIDLFYRRGFNAVGIDQVISAAGVTKTTFYKHFESKDDLMVSAVKLRDTWETAAWGRAVHKLAGDDPRKQLLAVWDVLDIWFNDPDFHGCIFMNVAAEFPDPTEPVHQAAAEYKRRGRDRFRDLARAAGVGFEEANAFADSYCALLEGALILRQVHNRNDAARSVKPTIEVLLETYLRSAKSAASMVA